MGQIRPRKRRKIQIEKKKKKKKKKKKIIKWTKLEEKCLAEAYKKYRKYENVPKFKPGVFSKIMTGKKYKKIFAKNKRTRATIKSKWHRMNAKLKLTKKWDKENKKNKNKNKNVSNDKSENDEDSEEESEDDDDDESDSS